MISVSWPFNSPSNASWIRSASAWYVTHIQMHPVDMHMYTCTALIRTPTNGIDCLNATEHCNMDNHWGLLGPDDRIGRLAPGTIASTGLWHPLRTSNCTYTCHDRCMPLELMIMCALLLLSPKPARKRAVKQSH